MLLFVKAPTKHSFAKPRDFRNPPLNGNEMMVLSSVSTKLIKCMSVKEKNWNFIKYLDWTWVHTYA
ncbi:hypothetical protein YQE_03320, partial [Dendroctonus ponderosae]